MVFLLAREAFKRVSKEALVVFRLCTTSLFFKESSYNSGSILSVLSGSNRRALANSNAAMALKLAAKLSWTA